jgi:DNA polymerase III alpha subunit (gram-positive type)
MSTPKSIVVDIETSGLMLGHHEVIEVGYVLMPEWVSVEFSLDFDIDKADPQALEVNQWGKREFAGRLHNVHAATLMRSDFRDRLVVASPAHFDVAFLQEWHQQRGFRVPWSHRDVVDLKSVYRTLFGLDADANNKVMGERVQVEFPANAHRALVDAEYTARVWDALCTMREERLG